MQANTAVQTVQASQEQQLQLLGVDLFERAATIDALTTEQNKTRDLFGKLAGEGSTITVPGKGKVSVTHTTTDRPGDLATTFNFDAYIALPDSLKARLVKAGVVVTERKTIKGQASQVKLYKA